VEADVAEPSDLVRALGLAKNPFAAPSEDLFGGGDRMRQLDELRHLSRWSRRLLVVTGERGVGKSTMYRALASRLDPGVKAARINANLVNESRELLTSIVQGFGIATPAKATPELLVDLISVHVAEHALAERACVVLVDDAQQIELRALDQLLRLTEAGGDNGLRIVFFAETYFVQMLDKAVSRLETPLAWHEIRLSAFSPEEVRQYLKLRFESAGYDGALPFTDAELQGIVSASNGLPGKIDEIAGGILDGAITVKEASTWLPPWHRALAALLVVAIGITWLVWDDDETSSSESPSSAAAAQDTAPVPPIAIPQRPLRVDTQTPSPAPDDERESITASAPVEPPAPAKPDVTSAESATVAGRAAPDTRIEHKAEEPTKPPPRAPEPSRPVAKAQPAPTGRAWLDAQPDARFTLQLLGTSSRARVEEYLAKQPAGSPVAAYRSERNGSPWYVVIYGSYESAEAATAAARRLPGSIGKVTPWVRRFGTVRTDIKG
jgi:DamX protein